jgi:DNA polymerase-3 subunit gamma/tau
VTEQGTRLSLYRRWRPQRFADVVGQTEIVRTLRNAVAAGEIAHAYLFAGERGIGKTSVARILSRAINCLASSEGEPCNECSNCETILSNRSLDIIEIDGASNRGIDHIRRLREEVNFSPTALRRKAYIIDEVHMLTNEAFNALLKTLEEPPLHAVFIFATTEPHKVPRTIISRCQAFEFRRIAPERIAAHLGKVSREEGVALTQEALEVLGRRANGAVRDALVMLEQAMSYESGEINAEIVFEMLGLVGRETHEVFVKAVEENDRQTALRMVDALVDRGKDLEIFLSDVIDLLRTRIADGSGDAERDIAIARGLLAIKTDLFRALDRRIRLEIGVLDLMTKLAPDDASGAATRASNGVAPHDGADSAGVEPEIAPDLFRPSPSGQSRSSSPVQAPPTRLDPGETPSQPTSSEFASAWEAFVAQIGRERVAIAAFLTEARPLFRDEKLILSFHPEHAFHKESLEKQANLQYLAGAVRRSFGDGVRIEVEYDEGVPRTPLPREVLSEKARLVCRVFDGTIVKEEL